jgi:hypothetical protein
MIIPYIVVVTGIPLYMVGWYLLGYLDMLSRYLYVRGQYRKVPAGDIHAYLVSHPGASPVVIYFEQATYVPPHHIA